MASEDCCDFAQDDKQINAWAHMFKLLFVKDVSFILYIYMYRICVCVNLTVFVEMVMYVQVKNMFR